MRLWFCSIIVFLLAAGASAGTPPNPVFAALTDGDPTLVSADEAAPESDQAHNSNRDADLTYMYAWLEGANLDTLVVALDFTSSWNGIHLLVVLETKGDVAGATQDPFEFPVAYGHSLKPDYVFTYKYSSEDYADLRRWAGTGWEFWQLPTGTWTTVEDDRKNAIGIVVRTASQVRFRFPMTAIGQVSPGDTLRLQTYVTQEALTAKYTALDSDPHDATHDMLPASGNWWDAAANQVTLSHYALFVMPSFGNPPNLSDAAVSPDTAEVGDDVTFSVSVAPAGGGIGRVSVDLSPIGGDWRTALHDDGTRGDAHASDGVFSAVFRVPPDVPGGAKSILFTAADTSQVTQRSIAGMLVIPAESLIFKSVSDLTGDDHGPSIADSKGNPAAGLYYFYPTNAVFKPGIFDIGKVDLTIDGPYLVIRLHVGNVLTNAEGGNWGALYPSASCTNPNRAQINQPKIDIYIDSQEGVGAAVAFPSRFVDIAPADAWEYGVAIEGWWKGLVRSNGSNSMSDWALSKVPEAIDVCNDCVQDYIDIKIGLGAIGNPSKEDIKKWDFIMTMASHDGDSYDINLGGIRWVNSATSEWQFGGGADGEAGRERDANIIDVIAVPGDGKPSGRSQQAMLNYLAPDAQARFDQGLNSCALEATSQFPGSASGRVTLLEASDSATTVTVNALRAGKVFASTQTAPGGGAYEIKSLPDGTYDVEARARSYRKATVHGLVVQGGNQIRNVDFSLTKVPGAIFGNVLLGGPSKDVRVYAIHAITGELGGDDIKVVEGGTGKFELVAVEDATYHLIAQARGYARYDSLVTVSQGETLRVDIFPGIAYATKYVFIDSVIDVAHAPTYGLVPTLGNEVYSKKISKSLPDRGFFDFSSLLMEPRDDDGGAAIFDVSALDSVHLAATLLDPVVQARGDVVFADTLKDVIPGQVLTSGMFMDGAGRFLVSDDSVEVLRVWVTRGARTGSIEIGVGELRPARVSLMRLAPDSGEIVVGGSEKIEVGVQLLDMSGNRSPTPDVNIRMQTIEDGPIFEPEAGVTDANGYFKVLVYGFRSGPVKFAAEVMPGQFEGLPSDTLTAVFKPDKPREIMSKLAPRAVKRGGESKLAFQVVDAYGNPVGMSGVRIELESSPAELLASIETPATTDASGQAASRVVAGPKYGVVAIEARSTPVYPVESVDLTIDPRLVAVDEEAPETHPPHSNPSVDLTTMFAWLASDTLRVMLDFASSWEGVHLMIALKTKHDAAGATGDPFGFPVFYGHSLSPDFVFTYKYSAGDYADLRRGAGTAWEFWQLPTGTWTTVEDDRKNAVSMVLKTETQVLFKFPMNGVGEIIPGDTVRLEAYVTQQTPDGKKYTALDSDPPDDTHDMLPANWYDTAITPRDLSKWAEYVFPSAGEAPALSNPLVTPTSASPGERVKVSVAANDQGGGIGDVLADLSPIGGDATTRLNDDGTGGDQQAGDGIYAASFTIPDVVTQGLHNVWFTARDSLNISETRATASITIVNPPAVFIAVVDSTGDDHGPNTTDASGRPVEGLYYLYPTNGVFAPGVFDIRKVDFMIDGPFLVIRVYVGEVPSSEAVGWNAPYPAETCTNPNKADLNLQKIDIYIDSKEGAGATAGLPYRYADIAGSDAWEFAAVSEGWWKGLIESNGQNSISFWTIIRQSNQIDFCDDYAENFIDVKIALSVLGDPAPEDIQKWDFIITMSGHDGESNDQNLGGTRSVNQATSEWQFGGGADGEAGRERDASIIDVVAVPGKGKVPGKTQEQMLNYRLADALRRFDSGVTACLLEATFSEDISPPVINPFPTDGFAHAVWYVLDNAPASFWTKIEDKSDVANAEFQWRPLGESDWRTSKMVNIIESYWIADIDPGVLRQAVNVIELVDGTPARPFEAMIEASDQYGNEAQTSLLTFAVPDQTLPYAVASGVQPGTGVIFYDGTIVMVPEQPGSPVFDAYDFKITPLAESGNEGVDLSTLRSSMTYLGVARNLEIVGHKGEYSQNISELENPVTLALHYPTYRDSQVGDEKKIGLFEYNDITARWIGIFGSSNEMGNAVTAEVRNAAAYALFNDRNLTYDAGKGLSGVRAEPNPFSPNGDGLYEETHISFFLSREADWVTIEIYDITGQAVRTLRWQLGLTATGRNAFEMIWDGMDDRGQVVPYGIYVLRVEARFKVAPYNERQNIGVVVIK